MKNAQTMLPHVLRAQDFTRAWLDKFFPKVRDLKHQMEKPAGRAKLRTLFRGLTMFLIFYEPSTRTRFSFSTAALNLGMSPLWTEDAQQFSSAAKGESLEDTAHTLLSYGPDVLVLRHFLDDAEKIVASISDAHFGGIPVINAGSGKMQHPTQALLDLYTIWERLGRLDNLTVVIGADALNGRTCRSLAYLLSMYWGVTIIFVTPPELRPPADLVSHLRERGVVCKFETELAPALPIADVLYWVRLQGERIKGVRARRRLRSRYKAYRITTAHAALLPQHALLLHPMPIVNEIAPAVKTNFPGFFAYAQSANGLPVRMALLCELLKHKVR